MRKVLDIISVVSFLLVAALTGGTVFGYFWITNEENQERIKKQVIDSVMSNVPIPGGLTGPALPTKAPPKRSTGNLKIPSF